MSDGAEGAIRLDKWLWQARFFKTRTLAARAVTAGAVRINAVRVVRPAAPVAVGDGLTVVQHGRVRVVRVLGLGTRRGPAPEAQALYLEIGGGGGASGGDGAEGLNPA